MANIIQGETKNTNCRIGIVTGRFNFEVTEKLESAAIATLKEKGLNDSQIICVRVPGAFEIPLAAQSLINKPCDAVIALGAVIRGDTSHYDYVCNAVERGCSELQLKYHKPVVFGVLTTENDEQAFDRAGGKHGNKGAEAAMVALEMVDLLKKLDQGRS